MGKLKSKINADGLEEILNPLMDRTGQFMPDLYQYYHNLLENRKIIFNQQIDDSLLELVIAPLIEMDNDGTGKPIELVIQSNGGSVWVAGILCNVIENMKTPLTITVAGYALSAGALIAMAKNKNVHRRCYPFSVFLIHNGSISFSDDKRKAKSLIAFDNAYDEDIKNYILKNTKIPLEVYEKEIEDEEYYFGAQKALELGIVDEIIGR